MLQDIDHSVTGQITAQLPGSRPSALRVTTDDQQVASLVGSYPSTDLQSAYSTALADRAVEIVKDSTDFERWSNRSMIFIIYFIFSPTGNSFLIILLGWGEMLGSQLG